MRSKTDLFTVNGQPMLAPDEEVSIGYEDLDAADSGRDESGVMHRIVVRHKVPNWNFTYSHLTEEEKQYMESLFGDETTFRFGHPARKDAGVQETTICYRSQYSLAWKNARTGLWSNYSFRIIAC